MLSIEGTGESCMHAHRSRDTRHDLQQGVCCRTHADGEHFTSHAKTPVCNQFPTERRRTPQPGHVGGSLSPAADTEHPAQQTPGCHKNTDSSDILPALRCFHNTSEIIEATSAAPRLQPILACVETCVYPQKKEKVLAARVAGAAALLSGNTSLKHTQRALLTCTRASNILS